MTVILVLVTFVAFLVIDHFYSKRRALRAVPAAVTRAEEIRPRLQPSIVAGFRVPDNVRYHPGHTWALSESPNLVRVGMDDFAGKVIGKVDKITFPQRGQWIRQGQKLLTIERNGLKIDMVSPIEGSVAEINEALAKEPGLARIDPYGDGWLLTVQSPDAKVNFRNLLGGSLARSWMEEAAARLRRRMPQFAGALAQDGGVAVDDVSALIPEAELQDVAHEFFLGYTRRASVPDTTPARAKLLRRGSVPNRIGVCPQMPYSRQVSCIRASSCDRGLRRLCSQHQSDQRNRLRTGRGGCFGTGTFSIPQSQ